MLLAYKEVSRRLWPEEAAWSAAAACSKVMPCSAMKVRNFGCGRPADAVSVLALLVVDGPDAQVPIDLDDLESVQDDLIGKGSRGDDERCCAGRFRNPICARICARDATGKTEMGEMQKIRDDLAAQAWRGQGGHWRLSETAETPVVWLITQRSRVQIPPPLPRPEALSRTERGPFACGLLTDT